MAIRLFDSAALCLRIFDVSDEIDLDACRHLVERAGSAPERLRLRREGSEYIQLSNPPLSVDLGSRAVLIGGRSHEAQLGARVFDHGNVSVQVRIPVEDGTSLEELVPVADAYYESRELDELARDTVERLCQVLAPALRGVHRWEQHEGYTVITVRRLEGGRPPDVLASPALPRLLVGETAAPALAAAEVQEILRHHFSYTDDDLAVIEWNAAFVYEPSGSGDIPDLLEVANSQLLALRAHDATLDRELDRLYEIVGRAARPLFGRSPYKGALRELMGTVIELSEYIERIENALKIVGDVYLARVYEGAVVQLRLRPWLAQVGRKHRLLQQTYGLLKGELDTGRALTLESMVVGLILLEIVLALLKVSGH